MALAGILKKLLLGRAFSAEEGRLTLLGKFNVCMYEADAFAYTIQKMSEEVGKEKTYKIFREAVKIATAHMVKVLGLKPRLEVIKKVMPFGEFYGWGKFEIRKFNYNDKIDVQIAIINSPIVEYALKSYGKNSNICTTFYRGVFSGFFSLVTKKKLKIKEESCKCRGAPYCVFSIRGKK